MSSTPGPVVPRTFGEYVERYFETRDDADLHDLRAAIVAHPSFDPDLAPTRVAAPFLEEGRAQDLLDDLLGRMPGAFFSAGTHTALATAYEMVGDTARQQREQSLAEAAVMTVLSTGDGTAERPWTVLRVSDEYDVLRAIGRRSTTGEYVERDGRLLDRLEQDDGGEAWFEIVRPTMTSRGEGSA